MASITIRNLDDQIKEQLRIAAAHNGHSMEEERWAWPMRRLPPFAELTAL